MAKTIGEKSHAGAWLTCLMALALPGAGHLRHGLIGRAVIMGGATWLIFAFGLILGGHLYGLFDSNTGLLSYVFGLCNIGSGLLYVFCWASGIGITEQAQLATSEYGNVFLLVAGLANYLLTIDAFDIAIGRKR